MLIRQFLCHKNCLQNELQVVPGNVTILGAGEGETLEATFHVGDTPFDVLAAQAAGVTPVGVATGVFRAEQLSAAVPEAHILPSLQDNSLLELLASS